MEQPERSDRSWRSHLRKRLELTAFGNVGELYASNQNALGHLLEEHGLPYEVVHVDPGSGSMERTQPLARFVRL